MEGEQVEEDRHQLEGDMEDHHAAVGRSSLPLSDNPGKQFKGGKIESVLESGAKSGERKTHLLGGNVKPACSSGSWVARGLYSLLTIFKPIEIFCLFSKQLFALLV